VGEFILAGRLKWTPTFEPRMVMKKLNCLLDNLESQLWAIECVEIFSSILHGLLVHLTFINTLYFDNYN
jgi:hypothetical protein